MSEGWSKLLDVGPLADGRAEIDFSIPLKYFPRLLPMLGAPAGEAVGRVAFSREGGIAMADISVAAEVMLTCQRCLAPLMRSVAGDARTALVATAAQAERIPGTLETVLAPDYRISLRDLVEEELLLALPLVPRHEDNSCAGDEAGTHGETQRPFGQLGELLKRQ